MTTTDTLSARDHILDAAESLFASKGFGPSTIKEIGARAGLNPALLYYYFGSKEELYQAVLRRLGEGLVARGSAAFEAATPAEAIRSLVNAQLEFLRAHPNVPKLVVRELVDHDAHHAQAVILQIAAGLFQRLCGVIERGQREGSFRRDVEPRFAAVSIIAQVVYFTIARPAVGIFLGLGPRGIDDATADAFGVHAGAFAVRALSTSEPTV